jgi:large subunit ribosomal protein L25
MITLSITKRDGKARLEEVRDSGLIPAVFYGHKEASTSISVKQPEFLKVWKEAGESSVINLVGEGMNHEALIQDLDFHPVTSAVRHVDFYVIEKGKKIKVDIQLEFVGVSPAVKDLGGILVKVAHEVEIEAMPKDLPKQLTVDIAALVNFESKIAAKDIVLPAGVTLVTKGEETIALVTEAKEEVVEAPVVDLSSIEVEKKGKEAKEGAEGAAEKADEAK